MLSNSFAFFPHPFFFYCSPKNLASISGMWEKFMIYYLDNHYLIPVMRM